MLTRTKMAVQSFGGLHNRPLQATKGCCLNMPRSSNSSKTPVDAIYPSLPRIPGISSTARHEGRHPRYCVGIATMGAYVLGFPQAHDNSLLQLSFGCPCIKACRIVVGALQDPPELHA